MLYTPLTKKALQISFEAHKNARDKSGMPYVYHPFHLAEQMKTEDEVVLALLHDVVEDTETTPDDLRAEGIPEKVLEALALLTRREEEDYGIYVRRLAKNPLARRVKMADLRHNGDLSRLDTVTERDRERAAKYKSAYRYLVWHRPFFGKR